MKKSKKTKKSSGQPKTRNLVAVAAHMRNSAGAHEPSKKQRHKQDRKQSRQDLRNMAYC